MVSISDVEKIIVTRSGAAVPVAGTSLFNPTTGVFNGAVGGLGAYIDQAGSGNPVAVTTGSYAGEPIRFIQVRDTSNDRTPLPNRYLEQSQYIHGNCQFGLEIAGQPVVAPSVNSWLLGAPNAQVTDTGKVSVSSLNTYVLNATSHGYRTDMYNSLYNMPTSYGRFESPDWATTSVTTEAARRDYTIQNLVADFNRKNSGSQWSQYGFALAISTADVAAGIDVGSVTLNSTITIGYDKGCKPVNVLVTAERKAALDALAAHLDALTYTNASIVPYNVSPNCGSGVAAGTSTSDMIFIVAIDEELAYYDEIPNTKRRLEVSLNEGSLIPSVAKTLITEPSEGQGQARNLRLDYINEEHYRSYTSSREWGANHVAYPDEIDLSKTYNIYTITHCHTRSATSGLPSVSPHRTVIAVPSDDATMKNYVESVVNAVATYYGYPTVTL
jgi:hypothetical protein